MASGSENSHETVQVGNERQWPGIRFAARHGLLPSRPRRQVRDDLLGRSSPVQRLSGSEALRGFEVRCYDEQVFQYALDIVREIDRQAGKSSVAELLASLRSGLGLDDFGELMFGMPMDDFPNLSKRLPRMASVAVQTNWTGTSGLRLLKQTSSFVRALACQFVRLTGRPIDGASILDFGCGYGRIARLMYYFSDPSNLIGVDPWDESIRICRECGLGENFRLSERLPVELPVDGRKFDLIYALSVFTHLSAKAAFQALQACRRYIKSDGILAITIRPVEYWSLDSTVHALKDTAKVRAEHAARGFAFSPMGFPVDGEDTYGNTSMTTEWIAQSVPDWRVVGVDRSLDDEYQLYVFLRPAGDSSSAGAR